MRRTTTGRRSGWALAAALAATAAMGAACQLDGDEDDRDESRAGPSGGAYGRDVSTTPAGYGREGDEQAFGSREDVERARALWREMEGYESWQRYHPAEDWHPGKGPHGRYLRIYLNEAAAGSLTAPRAILVKENYPERDESTLAAVTVMQKIEGYAPENGDWLWVKFGPDGEVLENEQAVPLAGRIAKGSGEGCIACHSAAGGGDLVFSNDADER